MTTRLRSVLWRTLLVSALVLTACGGDGSATERPSTPEPAAISFPSKILGMSVDRANVEDRIGQAEQPFVDSVGVFTMREGDLLRATLQVSRFTEDARPQRAEFRGGILSRVGATTPRQVRVGDQEIFITTGRNQNLFIWFRKRVFFVLTVTREFDFPRTLLRRVLDLEMEL